jgi:hypothetical protein
MPENPIGMPQYQNSWVLGTVLGFESVLSLGDLGFGFRFFPQIMILIRHVPIQNLTQNFWVSGFG